MKICKKIMIAIFICLLSLSLGACASKAGVENSESTTSELTASETTTSETTTSESKSVPSDNFEYDLTTKNWNVEGITVKYPLFTETNNQEKADNLNQLIMDDMGVFVDGIIAAAPDAKGVTIDAIYEGYNMGNTVFSIKYLGTRFFQGGPYPVNFYHTITLDMVKEERVALSDIFTIGENFVDTFKNGMYSPYMESLNLEEDEIVLSDAIGKQYTNEQLIQLFSDPNANYFLSDQGLMLSIEVPHVIGDHLEMAMNYEWLEGNIKKDHNLWKNYSYTIDSVG